MNYSYDRRAEQQELPFAQKAFDDAAGDFWYVQSALEEMHTKPLVEGALRALTDGSWDLEHGKVAPEKVKSFASEHAEHADNKLALLEKHLEETAKKVKAIRATLQHAKSKF